MLSSSYSTCLLVSEENEHAIIVDQEKQVKNVTGLFAFRKSYCQSTWKKIRNFVLTFICYTFSDPRCYKFISLPCLQTVVSFSWAIFAYFKILVLTLACVIQIAWFTWASWSKIAPDDPRKTMNWQLYCNSCSGGFICCQSCVCHFTLFPWCVEVQDGSVIKVVKALKDKRCTFRAMFALAMCRFARYRQNEIAFVFDSGSQALGRIINRG